MPQTIRITDHEAAGPTLAALEQRLVGIQTVLERLVGANEGADYLDARAAAKRLGISKASFHRQVAAGQFPQPVKIGTSSRWCWAELEKSVGKKRR